MHAVVLALLLLLPLAGAAQLKSDTVFFEGTNKPHHVSLRKGKYLLEHKWFYVTGELLWLSKYETNSTYKTYSYYKSGKPEAVWTHVDDKLHGVQLGWYETGELRDSSSCVNDTCIERTFYPSGKLKRVQHSLSGRIYIVEEWCENGQFVGRTVEDSVYYAYKKYWCNGNVMYEGMLIYSNIMVGEWKQYHENGNIELIAHYRYNPDSKSRADENPRVGEWRSYDENGKLTSVHVFDNDGNLISEEKFD